jgi:hypothetical protein
VNERVALVPGFPARLEPGVSKPGARATVFPTVLRNGERRETIMNRSCTHWMLPAALVVLLAGCGDDSSTPPGDDNDPASGFTAKVDGQSWAAEPISIAAGRAPGIAGGYLILGAQSLGAQSRSITITLANIAGPGTFPLGVDITVFGGHASLGDAGAIWATPDNGLAGTIDITTLEPTRIVATFHFTATPGYDNPSTTNRIVTEGKIDLALTSYPPAFSDVFGSSVTAALNNDAWAAADVMTTMTGSAGFGFTASTDERILEIGLEGVTEAGTYPLSRVHPFRSISLRGSRGGINDPFCCYGSTDELGGSITITSITATRVTGSFEATLEAAEDRPATGTMAITNAAFDVGLAP